MNEDILTRLREKASDARDLEKTIEDMETQLKERRASLYRLYHETLPDLMFEAGVDEVGLPASGNLPAMTAKLSPYYAANIAASWAEEKRQAAFNWLDRNGHGDLIKTQIAIAMPREEREEATRLAQELAPYNPEIKETVHVQTLTAWLREQVEKHGELPPLDIIGGTVGQVVKLKERKE